MDFTFTEEQQMLQDTTRRFIAKDYGFEARRQIKEKSPEGFSREVWQSLADIGLLSLNVPEDDGGLNGSAIDNMLVMNAVGEGLLLEPYLASAVMATRTIAAVGNEAQRAELLPALAGGEKIAVLAHEEPQTRFDRMDIQTRAWPVGNGYLVTGHKSVVAHGASADTLLVTARIGKAGEDGTLAVFRVQADAPGLRKLPYRTVDGVPASDIWLNQVFVPAEARLNGSDDVEARMCDVLDFALAAVCAEAVGALDKMLAATVEYTRNRKQFGQPIAKFQALQHRMADMVLHIEQARSMSYLAAVRCTDPDLQARARAMSAAKVVIGQACRYVGQQAVQLHGGMGVTDELDVSHYFKRLMAIELQFGNSDHHLEQYAAQLA
ncbi:acyl-CoA dehydrogenase family protein [Noviherbaspirillum sp. CPCC 100848]|uniref:Acyl-CoA dehydrogenase family protein n=1 Tax=Noviherbaspirillum album TaxID=3080276 RepID=A0ABU6JB48_9BURK|nr:acyl-CoA dehydrogenase family protein [Noviherbaspirillum sp. CPCC 100848]MEC4720877.1 acyl-CoA dehydrogenase family protein [Noviherbaspirillum sp. CPCC 100848]